jgi:hypothetical protein
VNGLIEEMSPTDLRMFTTRSLPIGMLVNVRLSPEGWSSHFEAAGVVHRSEPLGGGSDVGVFLGERLSEELVAACWLEMRRELRYPTVWSVWARSASQRKIMAATVLNYSFSGLQLRVPNPVSAGEELTLMSDQPLSTATVRWVAQTSSQEYMCGCQLPKSDGLKMALRLQLPQGKA